MMIWEVSWRQTTHQTSCNLTARMRGTVYCPMRSSVTTVGKRGREISPSCFCHSQLIPSCPPPLHASSFLAAHRIWLRPSVFSTMMFSRQSDQTLPKTLATPFEHFLPPPLSRCPSPPFPSVSLQQKKKREKTLNLMYSERFSCLLWLGVLLLSEAYLSSLRTGMWKVLISLYITLFLHLCGNVDFSTNIPMWNSDLIPCAYRT